MFLSRKHTKQTFQDLPSRFSVIIVGFVICEAVYTSETFYQYLVPILDSSNYLADYMCQVDLAAFPSSSVLRVVL